MMECIFCKVVAGEIPSKRVYEDEDMLAFSDINPQAPVHLLLIPKEHITSLAALADRHAPLVGRMMLRLRDLAKEAGLEDGFRVVNNCGARAGQTVSHIHFHLLGGRDLQWPPG